jgi:AcrR family transcriptional regulator
MANSNETVLTAGKILDAAEDVLRRFGPSKATVVDVARALGVSHGSVYRHFPSKVALRASVAKRWLARVSDPLEIIANEARPAEERLRRWFDFIISEKKKRAFDDPELFANYLELTVESQDVIADHRQELANQLAHIVKDGIERGEFRVSDPVATGMALLDATARFHDPSHAAQWIEPEISRAFEAVYILLLNGLKVNKS